MKDALNGASDRTGIRKQNKKKPAIDTGQNRKLNKQNCNELWNITWSNICVTRQE